MSVRRSRQTPVDLKLKILLQLLLLLHRAGKLLVSLAATEVIGQRKAPGFLKMWAAPL